MPPPTLLPHVVFAPPCAKFDVKFEGDVPSSEPDVRRRLLLCMPSFRSGSAFLSPAVMVEPPVLLVPVALLLSTCEPKPEPADGDAENS